MNCLEKYSHKILRQELLLRNTSQNIHETPIIKKVILNLGMKEVVKDKKRILISLLAMEAITGQKVVITRSKKMVASFKIRKGMIIGCKVILRGKALFSFLDRLNTMVFPRIKQFKVFTPCWINKDGDLSFRIRNLLDFVELERHFELFQDLPFLDITIVTNTHKEKEILSLLSGYQIPFLQK
jgi:large subunit ribosomal protein L5